MKKYQELKEKKKASLAKAILLVILGLFLLDFMGVIIKFMGEKYSVLQYAVARNGFGLIPVLFYLFYSFGFKWDRGRFNSRDKLISIGRGLSIFFAQFCFYLSLMKLEFATASTLAFASPIFLTALSIPILGTHVGIWRWSAVVLGFLGIIIIIKPGSDIFTYDALLPLGAALGYAFAGVLVKLFPKDVHTAKIQFYAQVTTLVATIFIALTTFSFSFIESISDLILLATMGVSGGIGAVLLISGYRLTAPSLIAPFEYFALPISFVLGWIFFMEWPFDRLFPGVMGIVLGGVIIAWREGSKRSNKNEFVH